MGQVLALVVTSRVGALILTLGESHPAEKEQGLAAPPSTWFSCAGGIPSAARRSGSPPVRNSGQEKKCSSDCCQLLAGQFDSGYVGIWMIVKEYPLLVFLRNEAYFLSSTQISNQK